MFDFLCDGTGCMHQSLIPLWTISVVMNRWPFWNASLAFRWFRWKCSIVFNGVGLENSGHAKSFSPSPDKKNCVLHDDHVVQRLHTGAFVWVHTISLTTCKSSGHLKRGRYNREWWRKMTRGCQLWWCCSPAPVFVSLSSKECVVIVVVKSTRMMQKKPRRDNAEAIWMISEIDKRSSMERNSVILILCLRIFWKPWEGRVGPEGLVNT